MHAPRFAGVKWLYDVPIRAHPFRFFRFERFHFANGEQDRDPRRLIGLLQPLANFQIGLAGCWITPDNSDDKDKPLAPGLPKLLLWEKLAIEPISLPLEAHQPGLLPHVLEGQLQLAAKQIESAKTALVFGPMWSSQP